MKRRNFIKAVGASAAAALAAPNIATAQGTNVLKFIPQSDVAVLDPIWTTAYVTRNHGHMIFDTLFSLDGDFKPQPQMAEGIVYSDDGKTARITLRPGLKWHDGTPVLARDCTASIARWGKRDSFGQTLMAVTDELSAPDDKTIQFKLKRPFSLVADALGKGGSNFPAMMPERLAKTDAFTQVTEMVGSGPYKFLPSERVAGHLLAYARNQDYVPRSDGTPSWAAGPKIAHFDRVEWHIIPDSATAAGALQGGEVDWWENPPADLLPLLRKNKDIKAEIMDPTGNMGCIRMNQLIPPFNNPAIRRAVLKAVNPEDFMAAVGGEDPAMWRTPTGLFCPGTPMANNTGLSVFSGKRDYAAAKAEILAAGYKGEKVVILAPTDFPILKGLADVCHDIYTKIGLNSEYQAMDWGSVIQRRAKTDPVDQGGWNTFCTYWAGMDQLNPVGHTFLRGLGKAGGLPGWPDSPKIESLRESWIYAPDQAAQKKLAIELQATAMEELPYIPVGQLLQATAWRKNITGIQNGFPVFWNVRKV